MNWKDSFKNFHFNRYLGFLHLIYIEYPLLVCWAHVWAYLLRTHETNEYFPHTMMKFYSYSGIHFFTQKNDFVIHNSKVPVYQSHQKKNVIIHHQEKCSVSFSTISKENILLPKIYESKKIPVGIKSHQIYSSFWKKTNQLIWMSRKSMNTILYHFDR